jgi:K+-sensing histidine kinase KdpD
VARELRAPINSMAAGAELLLGQMDSLDPDTVREILSAIRQNTIVLVEQVENLLCAASIRAGNLQVRPAALSPMDLLTEAQLSIEPLLHMRGQVLRLASRGSVPAVAADRRRIGQVLLNLISNASKVSPPEQSIDHTLCAGPGRVRFTVSDRGPGLTPGSTRGLFNLIRPADSTPGAGHAGLGLGLAVAQAIIEAHAGQIRARNRRGGGSAVWFELPKAPA